MGKSFNDRHRKGDDDEAIEALNDRQNRRAARKQDKEADLESPRNKNWREE